MKYFRRGTTKIYFKHTGTIATLSGPDLSSELNTGMLEITCGVAEVSGFSFQNNPIDVPDMCSEFVSKIPGEDTADDSEMTFYDEIDDTLAGQGTGSYWTELQKGSDGYVIFFPYGVSGSSGTAIAAGDECEVWPVTVAKSTREFTAGNEPARFMTTFTITAPPSQTAVVVA